MSEIIKFEPNQPRVLAFTYDKGKSVEGNYGEQFMRRTVEGDSVFLAPIVEQKLCELGYKAKEQVVIEKCVEGKQTRWNVRRQGGNSERRTEEAERPLAGQPMRQTEPIARQPLGSLAAAYRNFLREAVDLAIFATEYAKSKGFPLVFSAGEVQDLATSLYIQYGKEGNIRKMHDYQEMREEVAYARGAYEPRDHARAKPSGLSPEESQPLPEETEIPEEPEWVKEIIQNEDLGYMGNQRAI